MKVASDGLKISIGSSDFTSQYQRSFNAKNASIDLFFVDFLQVVTNATRLICTMLVTSQRVWLSTYYSVNGVIDH